MRSRFAGAIDRVDLTVVGLSLVVAAPVLGAGIRLVLSDWTPTLDDAFIVSRSYDVFSAHLPQTGAHSLAGAKGTTVHSPGPLLYLLLAIPVRLGAAWLPLFMAMVNATALSWCISLARRRGGVVFAYAAAVGFVLLIRAYGALSMAAIWNPIAGRIPLLLLGFLVWSVLDGEVRLLPATAAVASFTLQAHLSFGPPSVALLGIAVIGGVGTVVRSQRRPRIEVPESQLEDTSVLRRWSPIALAALVLAACWALPVYEQVTRERGNLEVIVDSGREDVARGGSDLALATAGRAVGVPPGFAHSEEGLKVSISESFGGFSVWDVLATGTATLLLCGVLAYGIQRRARRLWSGAVVALALLSSVAATAWQFPDEQLLVASYGFRWFAIAGVIVWLVVGLAGGVALAERRHQASTGAEESEGLRTQRPPGRHLIDRPRSLIVCAVVGIGIALTLPSADPIAPLYAPAEAVGDAVVDATRPGDRYLIGRSGRYDLAFTSVLGYRLRTSGRIPVTFGTVVRALGEPYRRAGRRCDGVIVLQPAGQPVPSRSRTVIVVSVPIQDSALEKMRVLIEPEQESSRSC